MFMLNIYLQGYFRIGFPLNFNHEPQICLFQQFSIFQLYNKLSFVVFCAFSSLFCSYCLCKIKLLTYNNLAVLKQHKTNIIAAITV